MSQSACLRWRQYSEASLLWRSIVGSPWMRACINTPVSTSKLRIQTKSETGQDDEPVPSVASMPSPVAKASMARPKPVVGRPSACSEVAAWESSVPNGLKASTASIIMHRVNRERSSIAWASPLVGDKFPSPTYSSSDWKRNFFP